ncbi:MAG TPA: alpha/beta fold hydrolase [Blastocatellia bacterium]|nr:alpha/beta fold hydrolase [Blastocatellia bacterium]
MSQGKIDKEQTPEINLTAINSAAIAPHRRWLGLSMALGVVGSVTLAFGATCYQLSQALIRPRLKRLSQLKSPHLRHLLKRRNIRFEDVTFHSFDGTRLYGWWIAAGADRPTIVLLHGVKKNRTDVLRGALVLCEAGFNVLIFDGRAHGDSGGRFVTYGFFERRDVESAIAWLVEHKQIDRHRLGLAGESMGAAIALQVAAHNPWVRAVWADSPFASLRRVSSEFLERVTHLPGSVLNPVVWTTIQVANYRGKFDVQAVDPQALAARITCPVYLVHGTADQLIAPVHSQNIHAALGGEKHLWLIEGARHARGVRHAKQHYADRIVNFFTEKLNNG